MSKKRTAATVSIECVVSCVASARGAPVSPRASSPSHLPFLFPPLVCPHTGRGWGWAYFGAARACTVREGVRLRGRTRVQGLLLLHTCTCPRPWCSRPSPAARWRASVLHHTPPCLYTHTPAIRPRTPSNLAATGVLLSSPGGSKTNVSTKTYSALSALQPSSKAAATAAASDENNGPPRLEKVCLPAVIRAVIHPVIP